MWYEREYVKPNVEDYAKTRGRFKLTVPEYYNFGFDVVDKWAEDGTKLALIAVDQAGENPRHYTFSDMKLLSSKFANVLRGLGIVKGERVFVMLPRIPEWYVVLLGMIKVGVIPCPATVLCTPRDIEYRVNRAEMSMVLTDEEGAHKFGEIANKCPTVKHKIVVGGRLEGWMNYKEVMGKASQSLAKEEVVPTRHDDPMTLFFTSGTVKYPKMVIHTQDYPIGHYVTAYCGHDAKPTDLDWTLTETGWAKSSWATWGQWMCGQTLFIQDARGKFDPELTLRILERYGVNVFCAPPTAVRMMVLEDLSKYDFRRLRHCLSAGEPLNPETIGVWKGATGIDIYDIYGQTETTMVVGNLRGMPIKLGSMGVPALNYDVAIVDDEARELPRGEEGHIAIRVKPNRPVGLFKEYWKEPEEMAGVFKGNWYYTGDRAKRDADGYFWFMGRADDVIISAGYRIGPFEIESVLLEHPAIAESAVVASPDPIRGEVVKAFVVLAPGYEPGEKLTEELQEHVKTITAPYKYPRAIEYVEELPKTISGKIKRGELKKREWEGYKSNQGTNLA